MVFSAEKCKRKMKATEKLLETKHSGCRYCCCCCQYYYVAAAAAATAVFGGGDGAVACLGSDLDRCRSMYTYRTLVMILRVARNCVSAFCSFCSRVHDIPVH